MQEKAFEKEKSVVGPMFDSIAWKYDFLNHLLSFGIDKSWRRKAVREITRLNKNPEILDVATGTGDLAIEAARANPKCITGIDISEKMLELGRRKIESQGYSQLIRLLKCESENICFPDNTFDVAMVAFGVRNFTDPLKGLSEMRRVLRPGGQMVVLEFSRPDRFPLSIVYNFYFRHLLPVIGGLVSKKKNAYRYLHDSVMKFADNENFIKIMELAGLIQVSQKRLTGGIATIYTGFKKRIQ